MKTVLITGCSTGFGRGMVDEFLGRGWFVIATMRRAEERRELLAEPLAAYPDRLRLLDLDVADPAAREAAAAAVREHGRLDALVNNAGFGQFGALEDLDEEQLRRVFEVNFFGSALLTRALLPPLRAAKGVVVFVSSVFGINGFPLTGAYCASKFAMEGLAECLHYELAPHGVHVALIEPGANKTAFGENVQWGTGAVPAYETQTANYHRLKANLNSRDRTPTVARLAADMAERRTGRIRARVGPDAHLGYLAREWIPDFLRLPLTRFLYGRIFLKEVPR